MTRGNGPVTECGVALGADKRRALISLVYLVVENSAVVDCRCNVTAFAAAARFYRNFFRRLAGRVHRLDVVTLRALQIRMRFMAKGAGRDTIARSRERPPILRAHRGRGPLVKICGQRFSTWQLVTRMAVLRQRRELTLLVVTREATRVSKWS